MHAIHENRWVRAKVQTGWYLRVASDETSGIVFPLPHHTSVRSFYYRIARGARGGPNQLPGWNVIKRRRVYIEWP